MNESLRRSAEFIHNGTSEPNFDSCRPSTLTSVIDNVLTSMETGGALNVEKLRALAFCISPDLVHKALDILNKKRLTLVIAKPSGRHYFYVNSERKNKNPYICFHNYCSCFDFSQEVVGAKKMFCKHLLAVRFCSLSAWVNLSVRYATDYELSVWLASTLSESRHHSLYWPCTTNAFVFASIHLRSKYIFDTKNNSFDIIPTFLP